MKYMFAAALALGLFACDSAEDFNTTDLVAGSAFDDSQIDGTSIGMKVDCDNETDRSKVSVDANNLVAGTYSASVESGGVEIASASDQETVDDEVEFDFDSNTDDIAEGATEISQDFIQDNVVIGRIFREDGELVASLEVDCDD